jgi:hypothetical protein
MSRVPFVASAGVADNNPTATALLTTLLMQCSPPGFSGDSMRATRLCTPGERLPF